MRLNYLVFLALIRICFTETLYGKTLISLQKAFDKKYITAKATSKGGLELNYTVTNLLGDSLCITIPAGWRFNSDAKKNDYQDILLTHQEILFLNPKETKKLNIKGFCCEATKSGPVDGIPYTSGKLADSNLVELARYLNGHEIDQNTQQYSVWAISDHQETANITCKNDSVASLLRMVVSKIKGEPLPWYTVLKKASISSTGAITDCPIKFRANIPYAIPKTCYAYCYIIDEKGAIVSEILGNWLQPENKKYKVNFNVAGLKKGGYKVVLKNTYEPLFEKSFQI